MSNQLQLTYMVKPLNKNFICIYGFLAELKNSLENKHFFVYVARLMCWENIKTKSPHGVYFCEMFHNDKHTELILAREVTCAIDHSFCRGIFSVDPRLSFYYLIVVAVVITAMTMLIQICITIERDITNYYYFRSIIKLFIYFNSWVYL